MQKGESVGLKNMGETRPAVAILLSVVVALGGCAARTPSLSNGHATSSSGERQEIPASYVSQLPVGKQVEVRLQGGEKFKATLMGVEGEEVRLQRTGRLPVPPELIPLDSIASIRLASGGMSAGKAVLLGIGAGAAAFFGLLLLSVAAWAD